MRIHVHVEAASFLYKLKHLRELEWVLPIVDLSTVNHTHVGLRGNITRDRHKSTDLKESDHAHK